MHYDILRMAHTHINIKRETFTEFKLEPSTFSKVKHRFRETKPQVSAAKYHYIDSQQQKIEEDTHNDPIWNQRL